MPKQSFQTVWLALTYNCNNKCSWCYAASNFNDIRLRAFEADCVPATLSLLAELGVEHIILIGGEPTLYSEVTQVIRAIREKNIRVGMVTNGRRFSDPEFVKQVKVAGLPACCIAFSGPDASSHDHNTGIAGSYDEAMQGLDNLIAAGITVATNTVISAVTINYLPEIVKSLATKNVEYLGFNVCAPCIGEATNNSAMISPRRAVKAFEEVYDLARSLGKKAKLVTPMPLCFFSAEWLKENSKKKGVFGGGPCQLVHGRNFVVDFNGDVVPCTHLSGYSMFNIFQDGQVISRDKFIAEYEGSDEFRGKMRHYPSVQCGHEHCPKKCAGGCPLFWTVFDPEAEITPVATQKALDKPA